MDVVVECDNQADNLKRLHFESYNHANIILRGLNQLRMDGSMFDVIILADDDLQIPAHRAVLASCSEYFRVMFKDINCSTHYKEKNQISIKISNVPSTGIKLLLEFIYTSKLELNLMNIHDVLAAANYIQLETVIEACLNYLETELDEENCIDILVIAENYSMKSLSEKVYHYICGNIQKVASKSDFNRLTPRQLEYILSRDFPVDCSEIKILHIVLDWILKYDEPQKADYMKILKNVHFKELQVKEIEFLMKTLNIKKTDQIYHIIWCLIDPNNDGTSNFLQSTKLINCRGMALAIIKIGGFKLSGITNEITYNFVSKNSPAITESWKHLTSIPHIKQSSYGTAILNNQVYIVGGSYDISLEEYIHPFGFRYNPIEDKWFTIGPMKQDRCRFSLNVVGQYLIAVGGNSEQEDDVIAFNGQHGHTNYSTAEKYDPEKDSWEYIARIPEYRIQHSAVSLNSFLYVSGGIDGSGNTLNSFYCYNSGCDYWDRLQPMLSPRADHVMLEINSKIYVCGGWQEFNGQRTLVNTIDTYDFNTKEWQIVTSIPIPKYHAGITSVDDTIYLMGGFCTDDIFKSTAKTIECYDIKLNKWHTLQKYPKNIWEHTLKKIYLPRFRDDMEILVDESPASLIRS